MAVQREGSGSCTHGNAMKHGYADHNDHSLIILITETGRIVTKSEEHAQKTSIVADKWDQLSKSNEQ